MNRSFPFICTALMVAGMATSPVWAADDESADTGFKASGRVYSYGEHSYTRKINMHASPFATESMPASQREDSSAAYNQGGVDQDDSPFSSSVYSRPNVQPAPRRRKRRDDEDEEDDNWIKLPSDKDRDDEGPQLFKDSSSDESGWGWLADHVKEQKESEAERAETKEEEETATVFSSLPQEESDYKITGRQFERVSSIPESSQESIYTDPHMTLDPDKLRKLANDPSQIQGVVQQGGWSTSASKKSHSDSNNRYYDSAYRQNQGMASISSGMGQQDRSLYSRELSRTVSYSPVRSLRSQGAYGGSRLTGITSMPKPTSVGGGYAPVANMTKPSFSSRFSTHNAGGAGSSAGYDKGRRLHSTSPMQPYKPLVDSGFSR